MTTIFGHLNISDSDRVYNSTAGQRAIFDAVTEYLERVNADMRRALAVLVDETTSDFKRRYKLPGGGYLQRRGPDGRYGSVKATGQWDVAFPLEDFGAMISGNDVDMAYMTISELERHINTVVTQSINTRRFEMLKAIMNNTARTFVDPLHGSLTIQPLANNDTVVYPPVLGSDDEAVENHYAETGYAPAAISDTNNPYALAAADMEEHFGASMNLVTFINPDSEAPTKALTDFVKAPQRDVTPGMGTDLATGLPTNLPGKIIGKAGDNWVSVWRYIPATYQLTVNLDSAKPLVERVDPEDTGLGQGLQLVARDLEFPFESSVWRDRFGMGVGNRLNGVVYELANGGGYTIPTAYA
jgi:hypothetical protein